jgi:precorrin-2 dehydrogenase/sirohydrochlorin ferrochelatase
MFPILVDLDRVPVALVGRGAATTRRLAQLDEDGARLVTIFAPDAEPALAQAAGDRLRRRLPTSGEIAAVQLLLIADVAEEIARDLAALARAARVLVHVEDRADLTDLHMPAQVRRGDLLITISTGGQSPGLAARLRRTIESLIGPEWRERVGELAAQRGRWRRTGIRGRDLARKTDAWIDRKGWLPPPADPGKS